MAGVEKLFENRTPREIAKQLSDLGYRCTRQNVEHWKKKQYVTPKWVLPVANTYDIPVQELIRQPN